MPSHMKIVVLILKVFRQQICSTTLLHAYNLLDGDTKCKDQCLPSLHQPDNIGMYVMCEKGSDYRHYL